MKTADKHKGYALEDQVLNDLDAETDEVIRAVDRKKDPSSDDQGEEFRIWRCQGVSIGLHIHKKKP